MHACMYVKMISCLSSYYKYESIKSTYVLLGDFPAKVCGKPNHKSSRTVLYMSWIDNAQSIYSVGLRCVASLNLMGHSYSHSRPPFHL